MFCFWVELGQDAGAGAGAGAGPGSQEDVDGIDEDVRSLMQENETMQDFLLRMKKAGLGLGPVQDYGQKVMNVEGLGPIEVRNAMRMMRDDASYVGQGEGGSGGSGGSGGGGGVVVEGVALAELVSGAPAIADANLNGRVGYSVR